ncbi:MAG TPA: dimethylargininase, partial [Xanthomonadales bacterium]|nr:dimethylargininase [Xanthomonadales bacterium]
MAMAITRAVSPAFAKCELSFVAREPIDLALAHAQHAAYNEALRRAGCEVMQLPAEADFPDSVFVEDTAIVLDDVAVITRPGAASRRGEVDSIARALRAHRPLLALEAPATLDGGDVLRVGRTLYVGESARSNRDGVAQLRALLAPHGYAVETLPIAGCLHLKSAVTLVDDGVLLVQPEWIDIAKLDGFALIEIDASEPHAANALRIGDTIVYPSCFPRTQAKLEAAGIRAIAVDVSELQKAEGA